MSLSLEKLIPDRYTREARLRPALLAALPAALCAMAWWPSLEGRLATLATLLTFSGATAWLAHFARDRGAQLQVRLYAMWGGMPSVAALRHRDGLLPAPLKARYHAFLTHSVPGITIPTAKAEEKDPEIADQNYDAACEWLRTKAREKKDRFPILFEENISYGFRRNFLALKPLAIAIAILAVISGSTAAVWEWTASHTMPSPAPFSAIVFAAIYAITCATTVTPEWVHRASVAYARQLLACCDALSQPRSASTPGGRTGSSPKGKKRAKR